MAERKMTDLTASQRQNFYRLEPETLFSLYEDSVHTDPLAQRVFPERIDVLRSNRLSQPRFFSFMSCDGSGLLHYNHCLIFYERLTEEQILHDFDQGTQIQKFVQQRRRESKALVDMDVQKLWFHNFGHRDTHKHGAKLLQKRESQLHAVANPLS